MRSPVDELEAQILNSVATATEQAPSALDPTGSFADLGVDSLAAAEIAATSGDLLGRDLEPELLYDYQSPAALADFLVGG